MTKPKTNTQAKITPKRIMGNFFFISAQRLCQLPICLFHKIHFSRFQTCWRRTVCQNRLRTASPQGIDAQASQGSVAPLTERSDETFSVVQFSSADRE